LQFRTRKVATIRDVAQLAGCGIASASRVLNRSGPVSAELRDKVMVAARDLGFEFSDVGRSLRSSRTRTVGCVVPSISNPVYSAAVQGIEDVSADHGLQLLLSSSGYDPDRELSAVRTLIAKRVDALILTVNDLHASPALDFVRSRDIQHCLLFNYDHGSPNACGVDNRAAAFEVGRMLAAYGHRHVGYIALRLTSSDRACQRLEGLEEACRNFGLAAPAILEIDERGEDLVGQLLAFLLQHPQTTGIFASNDQVAIEIMSILRKARVRVPTDISIVGFDGIDFGQMVEPTLATVVTNPYAMGRAAADMVLAQKSSDQPGCHTDVAGFVFRSGGSLGQAAAKTSLLEKLALPQQLSPPRNILQSTSEER
jgi:DNA-binding LacI/PurR family transcriptional regulator